MMQKESNSKREIFFHVGLGKAASTYLQYKVFPRFKNIRFIRRHYFKKHEEIIASGKHSRYLLSLEYDRQLQREVKKFSLNYPEAKLIIILREHDKWIASQYRRQVKNGSRLSFKEFFDLENENSYWKRIDLNFMDKIKTIEEHFQHKALVLFYEDLRKDTYAFLKKITDYTGATYHPSSLRIRPFHTSYNTKQLLFMQRVGKYFFKKNSGEIKNRFLKDINHRFSRLFCYILLYFALLVPKSLVKAEPLIPELELQKIRDFYKDDWNACHEYAQKNNLV
jgi:hypothetical protein